MESESQIGSSLEYTRRLEWARAGETDSLHWLIEEEVEWLQGLLQRKAPFRGATPLTTEDLVQETLLRVLKSTKPPKAKSKSQFRSWLATIATNTRIDGFKRCQGLASLEELDGEAQPNPGPPLSDTRAEEFELFRADLSFREEAVLMLRGYCRMGHARLAFLLKCESENGAQCLHTRTLRKVQKMAARNGVRTL